MVFAVLNFSKSTTKQQQIADSTTNDKKEKLIVDNSSGVDWRSQIVAKDAKIKLLQKRLDESLKGGNKLTKTLFSLPEKGSDEYNKLIKAEVEKEQEAASQARTERRKEWGRERMKSRYPGLFESLNMSEEARNNLISAMYSKSREEIHKMIGDENFEIYNSYLAKRAANKFMDSFQKKLGDTKLNEQQSSQLGELLTDAEKNKPSFYSNMNKMRRGRGWSMSADDLKKIKGDMNKAVREEASQYNELLKSSSSFLNEEQQAELEIYIGDRLIEKEKHTQYLDKMIDRKKTDK